MSNQLPVELRIKILQQKYEDFLQYKCGLAVEVVLSQSKARGTFLAISGDKYQVEQAFNELSIEPTEKEPAEVGGIVTYWYEASIMHTIVDHVTA